MEGRNLFFSSLRESRGRRPRLSARPVILTFAMTYPPWRAIPWEKARNPAACGGGEWTGEPSIWLRQTAVGFFLGINKIEELSH